MRRTLPTLVLVTLLALPAPGQESPLPEPDRKPALQLDPGGPAATVFALAFAADGRSVFAAGLDKAVRVYRDRGGKWEADAPLRVPVGPGNAGAVNALAASADGRWLAVAGRGPMRGEAWGGAAGVVIEGGRRSAAMTRDLGVIYLFDLANPAGGKVLRGHRGEVWGLAFAAGTPTPVLVSAAVEGEPAAGVVRVWDAAAGVELAPPRTGFPANRTRVGLGGWPAGAGKADVAVAVAWPEADPKAGGSLRLWDVARNAVTAQADGAFNQALAVLPGGGGKPDRVATGLFANFGVAGARQQGQIHVRPVAGGDPRVIGFPPVGATHFLPLAVAEAGGNLAVLLERSGGAAGERSTVLALIDPATSNLVGSAELSGVDAVFLPVLAAAPKGDVLAVAGFRDNRIELYAAADLRAGRAKPTVLPGGPAGFAGVRFLDGGAAIGLADAGGAELVFDFADRAVGPAAGPRKPDAPAGGARFEDVKLDGGRRGVRVTAGGPPVTCRLVPGAVPTAWAYKPGPRPLVAVGHDEEEHSKSLITLFDGATGRPLRQLTGHLRTVRSLAFSAAKPLLASAAADGTVCVWSLKDLDREPGAVEGLDVAERDGAVVVQAVTAEPLRPLLAAGDVIESAGGGEKPEPVKSVADFAWRAAAVAPGGTLPVRVRGKNQAVALPVVRGVDERKPLFTLWVGPGGREWVGWSPAGPYDVSGPDAEGRIGWLTNTGDPKAPAAFAGAEAYRKTFHHKGLLRFLAEQAELTAALDAWEDAFAPPAPQLTVRVAEAVGGVVRFGKATLAVDLVNAAPNYPLDRAELRYRVWPAGAPAPAWATAPADGRRSWSFDLPADGWKRGGYRAEVEFVRRRGGPVVARESTQFLAAPPAPTLALTVAGSEIDGGTPDGKRTVAVNRPTVRLAARAAGHGAEPVAVTVLAGGEERKLTDPIDLALKPGDNPVRVRAVHANATPDTRDAETAELAVVVRYDPPMKERTPAVGPIAFDPPGEAFRLGDRDVIAVAAPKVVASARVTAANPLTAVGVAAGDGKPEPLAPGGARAFTARRELTLTPGEPVRVAVTAATANSDPGEGSAVVAYVPPLPGVTVTPLPAAVTDPKLTVGGSFTPAGASFTLRVVVAGGTGSKAFDAATDGKAGTWSAAVTLFPGPNRLTAEVRNKWRTRSLDLGTVEYRRPPRIASGSADAGATGAADVVLAVETAEGLDPTGVRVDGRPVTMAPPERVAAKDGRVTWRVTAPAVPVAGRDTLTVRVGNADGDGDPAAVAVKRSAPPKAEPPRITLKGVDRDAATEADTLRVAFRVTSDSPVRTVEVWHRAGETGEYEAVPAAVRDGGGFARDAEAAVRLAVGPNRIRVVAVNAGGAAPPEEFTVSRKVPAPLVVIDGLDELTPEGTVARRLDVTDREPVLRFARAGGGYVAVRGSVRWADPADPALADPGLTAAVSVNETAHLPVPLEPAAGGVRRFRAPVFLNGADNAVRLEVRTGRQDLVPLDRAGRAGFRVGCATPLGRQRLHVVVIRVGDDGGPGEELVRRAVRALGGASPPGFEAAVLRRDAMPFQVPGFEQALLYRPLVGEVQSADVRGALALVADHVRGLAAATPPDGWVNDVVLIYYQGRDWVDDRDGRRLHTSRSLRSAAANWRNYTVALDDLPRSAGLRLVLMSVEDPAGRPAAARDPGLSVLRYAWPDPAGPGRLLDHLEGALAARERLGDVADHLKADLRGRTAGDPVEVLADPARDRRIGRGRR